MKYLGRALLMLFAMTIVTFGLIWLGIRKMFNGLFPVEDIGDGRWH